jgi:hypothetical protein
MHANERQDAMSPDFQIAAIAAGSAILGSAVAQIGPVIQDWLSARRSRRALLRERFEELANLTAELAGLVVAAAAHEPKSGAESPHASQQKLLEVTGRICVLCLVYFQPFEETANRVRNSSIRSVDALHDGNEKEALAASAEFAEQRRVLQAAIRTNAKRYT